MWLKKYMKIKHLKKTLKNKELFLGNPECWPDKNDGELIKIYKNKKGLADLRATCLTIGPDRFHFWEMFGERELGVCLWFDKTALLNDIIAGQNLRKGRVYYYTPTQLKRNCSIKDLPFAKREQYRDEKEFRVLREYSKEIAGTVPGIAFNPNSLKRIYFNSWLSEGDYQQNVKNINFLIERCYKDVDILQNKTHRFQKWIDAAKCVK